MPAALQTPLHIMLHLEHLSADGGTKDQTQKVARWAGGV
jgi:hypothetical protein